VLVVFHAHPHRYARLQHRVLYTHRHTKWSSLGRLPFRCVLCARVSSRAVWACRVRACVRVVVVVLPIALKYGRTTWAFVNTSKDSSTGNKNR
jgi:hypothetical protein